MIHSSLELTNFRSYDHAKFDLGTGITLVVGPNASGKTNLLESLYVLSTTKSFRAKDRDLIHHDKDFFRIVTTGDYGEISLGFDGANGGRTKKLTYDDVKQSLSSHIGRLGATLFDPSDLDLLHGVPEHRRRYLDGILCQTNPGYLKSLAEYKRVIRQRNSLLEGFAPDQIRDQIFAWDVRLTTTATEIYESRVALIEQLNLISPDMYRSIAAQTVDFVLEYKPTVSGSNYADAFLEALGQNLMRDLAAGFTTIGPHREDFRVHFNDANITTIASRGEVRTAILALKLAEINYIERMTGSKPILLLDDVFSELDHERRVQLLGQLVGYQTIITTTDADHIRVDLPKNYTLISTAEVSDE